jgi:sialic acid synthase SpsE/quercetin dioxygenase-like cupin family protein
MNITFDQLFIFEIANNHQGSVLHGKKIIDAMAEIAKKYGIRAGVKFQFRDLDTFIHPQHQKTSDVKHINRFQSTRLSPKEFSELVSHARKKGLMAIATPFDEASVQQCMDNEIDIVKIASCSAVDWPLLEAVSLTGKPVIVSSGGLSLSNIDKIVSFFQHKGAHFALLHCVGVYPTPNRLLHMNTIVRLIKRYPGVPIGYSGHEAPENTDAVTVAVSKGARLLERHVGVAEGEITLNGYSMDPAQTDAWVQAAQRAWEIAGSDQKQVSADETTSLRSLMRGTYAARPMKKGQKITAEDVYFAIPLQERQLTSGEFGTYRTTYTASRDYKADEPVSEKQTADPINLVRNAIHEAKGMLNEAGICTGDDCSFELSHHYGMERFHEVGAAIVNIINREYCKKFIVVLPGQRHPAHRHGKKEETFELLSGDLTVRLDDEVTKMKPGDRLLIKRNTWHSFSSEGGAIFEEISTTHFRDDSEYDDTAIGTSDPMERKTVIDPWKG